MEPQNGKYGFAILYDESLSGFQIRTEVTVDGLAYTSEMSLVPHVLRTLVEAQNNTEIAQKVIEMIATTRLIPVGNGQSVTLSQYIAGQTAGILDEMRMRRSVVGAGGQIIKP